MTTSSSILGMLYLLIPVFGILSVIPVLDDPNYLTKITKVKNKVIVGSIFQINLGLVYLLVGLLFFVSLANQTFVLRYSFVILRIVVFIINLIATLLVLRLLNLSKSISHFESRNIQDLKDQGDRLKASRDSLNHIFMIVALSLSNIVLFISLLRLNILPDWLSFWGIFGAFMSILASSLLLIEQTSIYSPFYLGLNLPTAIQELIFALWLLFIGF